MNKNANLLVSNGGGIDLTKNCIKYLLKHMGFIKRKACSKSKVNVERFHELKEAFLLEITNTAVMDNIPEDLIINFDQTGLNYVPVTSCTIEVVAKEDKQQLIAVFASSVDMCRKDRVVPSKFPAGCDTIESHQIVHTGYNL